MGPSDAHLGPLPAERLRGSDPLSSVGLPCCDALCIYVPPPLPRRVTRRLWRLSCLRIQRPSPR